MMPEQDYYQLLNIERSATQDEIKKAYRSMALQYHPDINAEEGAEERIKHLNQAYAVLGDPQQRRLYDMSGAGPRRAQPYWQGSTGSRPFGGCRRRGGGMRCGGMGIWQELLRKR